MHARTITRFGIFCPSKFDWFKVLLLLRLADKVTQERCYKKYNHHHLFCLTVSLEAHQAQQFSNTVSLVPSFQPPPRIILHDSILPLPFGLLHAIFGLSPFHFSRGVGNSAVLQMSELFFLNMYSSDIYLRGLFSP